MGLMRNFSYEGINLVSYDSCFIPLEEIELSLRFPHSDQAVPVTGNVVWNKQTGNRCMAGISIETTDKETINDEKQILVFSGIARPDDIESDNTILSSKIADARVYYVGDGVIQDKQKPGWLVRAMDKVWPF